jgi:pyrimidine-nucleoside phosphorylase
LGVPGRPAGGIDCLAQIPGYRTGFADVELDQVLERAGYAHFLADGRYAPLDARVFKLRQQHGLQEVPTLVAASLLSKKLAVGVRNAGLDIRVAPHGNFGRNSQEGERNAQLYRETAELLSIEAFPVLTDGTLPYQRYVGRSEALLALFRLFRGDVDTWLDEHYELCRGLACKAVPDEWKPAVRAAVRDDLRKAFEANVNAQGGSFAGFVGVAEQCSMGHRHELRAPANGVATYALEAIRKTLVELQSSVKASDACTFPDPVGLILQARPGSPVTAGSIVATARVDFPLKATEVVPRLMSALLQA